MRVIGLISGTSVDGIDAALVDIDGTDIDLKIKLIAGSTYPYPDEMREQILAVCAGKALSMAEFAELDDAIAQVFAQAALAIQANHVPAQLIGSHGQTVFHRPPQEQTEAGERGSSGGQADIKSKIENLKPTMGYSLQLGRGALIADLTGIPTISNFRVADIAVGGQGAPLVSRVDTYLLSHPTEHRCIQNIGGIGNVTYLPPRQGDWLENIRGWDTGPGNALIDLAVQHLTNGSQTYDKDGAWAASGHPCQPLVTAWLEHEFFMQPPPKSTGRELFGVDFLQKCLADAEKYELNSADLLATLTEFTVASIVHSYRHFLPQMPDTVFLCGGGSRNLYLKQRLQVYLSQNYDRETEPSSKTAELKDIADRNVGEWNRCPNPNFPSVVSVLTTDEEGLSAEYKEAIAFAVLAYWRHLGIPGNLVQVTGAKKAVVLGDFHPIAKSLRASTNSRTGAVSDRDKE